jgi:glycosyltransferase involved in cell wall biosynthesis
VAIPVFNEAEGLPGFLEELDQALTPHAGRLHFVVVDDASTDDTRAALEQTASRLQGQLEIYTSPRNRGHGPTLMEAYHRSLATEPDYVLQVDGDGQFHGSDLRRILLLLTDDARAASGVRRFRQDPWFRMLMTRALRSYLEWRFLVRARDANCPLRGYEAGLLAELLEVMSMDCLIPNLYLTILASRRGVAQLEVDVSHQVRRGPVAQGSTWEGKRGPRLPVPTRLLRFSFDAFRDLRMFREHMDEPRWARDSGPHATQPHHQR